MFGAVGAGGVAIHLLVLRGLLGLGVTFASAQVAAALTAMTSNYLVNNSVTYRDRRKRGLAILSGYLRFCMLCAIGLLANVAVASMFNHHFKIWWLSGLAGAGVGAAWNFVTTALAVW
nr:GtrA family protein [Phenylobacterium glaciei]